MATKGEMMTDPTNEHGLTAAEMTALLGALDDTAVTDENGNEVSTYSETLVAALQSLDSETPGVNVAMLPSAKRVLTELRDKHPHEMQTLWDKCIADPNALQFVLEEGE